MPSFIEHFKEKYDSSVFHAREKSYDGLMETDGRALGLCSNLMRGPAFIAGGILGFTGGALGAIGLGCVFTSPPALLIIFASNSFSGLFELPGAMAMGMGKFGYGMFQTLGRGLDAVCRVVDAGLQAGVKSMMNAPLLQKNDGDDDKRPPAQLKFGPVKHRTQPRSLANTFDLKSARAPQKKPEQDNIVAHKPVFMDDKSLRKGKIIL